MAQTVTDLKPQKRRKDRISVFLDGEFAFGLEEITAARLFIGQALTDQDIASLKEADSAEWAKQIAYRLLSYRPRSMVEVRRHLRKKDVDDGVIDQVIDRLLELKLLDDLAFAQYWVEQRETFKPRSRRALGHELYQKGLSRQIVEQVVEEVDEMAAARRAGEKKARLWRHLAEDEFHLKMRGFLGRRGFDYTITSEVSRELWRDTSENDGSIEI
jgi:regulatory protein